MTKQRRPPRQTISKKILSAPSKEQFVLRLYITGTSPRSMRAISNLKEVCETHLKGWYTLEVIDLYQQPALAERDQIVAAPTLIKRLPAPLKRLIGDMSDKNKILIGLDLKPNHSS